MNDVARLGAMNNASASRRFRTGARGPGPSLVLATSIALVGGCSDGSSTDASAGPDLGTDAVGQPSTGAPEVVVQVDDDAEASTEAVPLPTDSVRETIRITGYSPIVLPDSSVEIGAPIDDPSSPLDHESTTLHAYASSVLVGDYGSEASGPLATSVELRTAQRIVGFDLIADRAFGEGFPAGSSLASLVVMEPEYLTFVAVHGTAPDAQRL